MVTLTFYMERVLIQTILIVIGDTKIYREGGEH